MGTGCYAPRVSRRLWVEPICEVLQVAPWTYYAAKARRPCRRRVRDKELRVEIRRVHAENFANARAPGNRANSKRALACGLVMETVVRSLTRLGGVARVAGAA